MIEIPVQTTDPAVLERMRQTLQAAMQGDESAVPEVRRLLAEHREVVDRYGDLARQVEESWKALIAGPDLVLREALGIKLESMRQELLGPTSTPLERLLVERIVVGWLAVEHADALVAQCRDATPAHHAALQRRLTSCEGRFQRAVRGLGTLRKLIRPPLSPIDLMDCPVPETPGRDIARRRAGVPASVTN